MATYAIGDIQGCAKTFLTLLKTLNFNADGDRLWLVGDLVNRGPDSLTVLRYLHNIKTSVQMVLGNHDLHLLAVASGVESLRADDTIDDVLNAPDKQELLFWLRQQPLFFKDGRYALVHAGLVPSWDFAMAQALSSEVEALLKSDVHPELLKNMRGGKPQHWSEDLEGWERYRVILNAFTRMRVLDATGGMDFSYKGDYQNIPQNHTPWFDLPTKRPRDVTLICGHWSALGLHINPNLVSIDSGCIWGGPLTAYCLETQEVTQVINQD
ncbi:MAG: symmetrical bis(5'-nucleosyl)-tetraphosphatase [Proteobacteria bacterium]|nr:symmetrical bis(5'-nucleosyl)-tetraphosphatase [Pseudomonadota bacterium]MDA1331492.1 symmetrical bis(5'-nucleosyl)-tetraphosphatase [Pseudomonadota bacterium]